MKWLWICILNISVLQAQVDRYALVINEIMVDPSPTVGLPNAEYIELRNCSKQTIDLNKWKIEKGSSTYIIGGTIFLKPDSLIVLCSKSNLNLLSQHSRAFAMNSFPSLINDEGLLILKSPENKTIHAIAYTSSWHENTIKSTGGWSLEMIDPNKPCAENNWTSSVHSSGGTPGAENSVYKSKSIVDELNINQCIGVTDKSLLLQFNNGMDSAALSNPINYTIANTAIQIQSAKTTGPLFNEVMLTLTSSLNANTIYKLRLNNLQSCKREKSFAGEIETGLLKDPLPNDIIINEILFNPPADGKDFIELLNNTNSIININDLYLSSFNQLGALKTSYKIGEGFFNLFPKDYVIITEDTAFVKKYWPSSFHKKMIQLKTLPSLPDDNGNIAVLDKQGKQIDKMVYSDNMHYPFLHDVSGVSLERIESNGLSDERSNWHSASSSSNYATPTQENSQHKKTISTNSSFTPSSHVITPNNDGVEDIFQLQYKLSEAGYMCSVYLFGLNGNMIMKIIDNQLLGTSGSILWNGLKGTSLLPSGIYVIYVEATHLKSKTIKEKLVVAIR